MIRIKRIYGPRAKADGVRVLVDRIWPRGLTKDQAQIDLWMKDIAPSTALRKWFAHDLEKWPEFKQRYFRELLSHRDKITDLVAKAKHGQVTLLYGAKEKRYNNAVALREFMEGIEWRDPRSHL